MRSRPRQPASSNGEILDNQKHLHQSVGGIKTENNVVSVPSFYWIAKFHKTTLYDRFTHGANHYAIENSYLNYS